MCTFIGDGDGEDLGGVLVIMGVVTTIYFSLAFTLTYVLSGGAGLKFLAYALLIFTLD